MLIGYNNDVQYRGKTFHIQTEDRGAPAHQIETQIFHSGAILDTRIVSYAEKVNEIADKETRNKSIKQLMQVTHRELYKNLFAGQYDAFAGLEPLTEKVDPAEVAADEFNPSQERVPEAARVLEEQGADAFEIEEAGDHVDIASLKDRLAQMSGLGDDDDGDELDADNLTTQAIADLDDKPRLVQSDAAKPRDVGAPNKPILSLSGKHRSLSSKKNVTYNKSGERAWQGCLPPDDDLSIITLVEDFLARS